MYRIELLGGLRARRGSIVIDRFRTEKTASLLAYLAYNLQRPQAREVLVDRLWPEADCRSGKHRLRVALSSLRGQFVGSRPDEAVFLADHRHVRLNPAMVTTDVAEFEEACIAAERTGPGMRLVRLKHAVSLYTGELLPGMYDAWIVPQQVRLEALFERTALALVLEKEQEGDLAGATADAIHAVGIVPCSEALHGALLRLYRATGQAAAAIRHIQALEDTFRRRCDGDLSEKLNTLLGQGQSEQASTEPLIPSPSGRIPAHLTRFIGREVLMASLRDIAMPALPPDAPNHPEAERRHRLLSLTGPGGSGKSRLACELAWSLYDAYSGRVWFISLSEVTDPCHIEQKIHRALGLFNSPGTDLHVQTVRFLLPKPSLLVLDNYEQLLPEGASHLANLLKAVPQLTCIATSRRALNIIGELQCPVPPLAVPADCRELSPRAAPSVELFCSRARAAGGSFESTPESEAAIADLCNRLEGMPLALELAAARASMMTPRDMVRRLDDRFALLSVGFADAEPRHRSLRAAIDWSYDLLPVHIRRMFVRLSVFRGGWTAEAAASVCPSANPLSELAALRDSSLISPQIAPVAPVAPDMQDTCGGVRFCMMETLREYAASRLYTRDAKAARIRHAAYYCQLACSAEPELLGPEQGKWLSCLEREHDNLRAVLDWSVSSAGNSLVGLELAGRLWRFWLIRCHLAEGRARLHTFLSHPSLQASTVERARALHGAGVLARNDGDFETAKSHLSEGLEIYRRLGLREAEAFALSNLGVTAAQQMQFETAEDLLGEALLQFRELAHPRGIAVTAGDLANVERNLGNVIRAQNLLEESLALHRERRDAWGKAVTLTTLGRIACAEGRLQSAKAMLDEAKTLWREIGDTRGLAACLLGLSDSLRRMGILDEAMRCAEESLRLHLSHGSPQPIILSLEAFSRLFAAARNLTSAGEMLGAIEAARAAGGILRQPYEARAHEAFLAELQSLSGGAGLEASIHSGSEMTLEQAVSRAFVG